MAFLLIMVLALAGCASDDETASDTDTPAPAADQAEAADDDAPTEPGDDTPADEPAQSFAGQQLVVAGPQANIIETVRDTVAAEFAERTDGATIQWIDGGAPQNLQQILGAQGGPAPFDVAFLDNVEQARAIEAGVLEEVDYDLIPSIDKLPPEAFPHEGYGPGWVLIRLGSCVRTDLYEEGGIDLPTGIEGWFDPAISGRIALADTSNFFWLATMPAFADHFDVPFDDPSPLIDRFAEIDVHTVFTSSGDGQALLQSGEVMLAPLTDGRCLNLKLAGEPVDFIPLNLDIEGTTYEWVALVDTWDIVAGTEQRELAHIFIDVMLNESGVFPLASEFGYLPAHGDVLAQVREDPELEGLIPSDFSFDTSYVPDYQEFFPHADAWVDEWARAFRS